MAPQSRRTAPSLECLLCEEAYRFDFFQAVRVLERLYAGRKPVGQDAEPAQEVVRFRSRLSLSFPPSEIYEIARQANRAVPIEMTVSFMGLTGLLGVLPRHYTELLLERVRNKDLALRDFLDLFNHRFISFFYGAWKKYRLPIAYERAALDREGYDCFSLCLFDLIGMGTRGLRGRLEVEDDALLFYAGLLSQHPRSASALASLLQDYFGVPVEVIQLTGQWLLLAPENRSRLGPSEANNALGVSAVLGGCVWDQQAQFTLRLGPLTFPTFCQFLPSGSAFRSLVQLTRYFIGQECDFAIQLVLKAAAVPWCRLGETGDHAPQLGWSTWLKTGEFKHDAGDTILASHLKYTKPQRQGASTGSGEGQHAREPEVSDWHIERYVPQHA